MGIKRNVSAVLIGTVVALLAFGFDAASADPPQELFFEKVCPNAHPEYCVIQNADLLETPDGTLDLNGVKVWYFGPGQLGKENAHGLQISSEVVIGPGESEPTDVWANGHFRWQFDHGSWTISRGEGPLAGLHAQGGMALVDCDDDSCTFALSGTYHVEG